MTDQVKSDLMDAEIEMEMNEQERDGKFNTKERKEFRHFYFKRLVELQIELVELQEWVREEGKRVVILFEGRDAAGKGGVIKRITQRTDPKVFRIKALPIPTAQEKTQWYFQRYVKHLPSAGQIVLFDRSWYNRGGVERVMKFCTTEQVEAFFTSAPLFEKMLTDDGIILIKYWFAISEEEQQFRFDCRKELPIKQWKYSKVDAEAQDRWDAYTKAELDVFQYTSTPTAPWTIVPGDDKKRARLNCIQDIIKTINHKGHPDKRNKPGHKQGACKTVEIY